MMPESKPPLLGQRTANQSYIITIASNDPEVSVAE
jgi:hypothetical protein